MYMSYRNPYHIDLKRTITNLYLLFVAAEKAKEANTAAHSEKYVFKIARCWGSPCFAAAALKLGQNIHKKIVPTIENMSELLDDPWKKML